MERVDFGGQNGNRTKKYIWASISSVRQDGTVSLKHDDDGAGPLLWLSFGFVCFPIVQPNECFIFTFSAQMVVKSRDAV